MLVICCLTRVINGKIIEDETIYNFWRFLVEDFFLQVIKPPGTFFNNELLRSCRSSKFSSSFPATSVLLCNLRKRRNYDTHINEHGQSLLDICKSCDLRIVNGRTTGDSFGNITYHSPKGISTVDYFVVSHEILNLTENFIVKEPTIFSDHSQLICWLNISPSISPQTNTPPQAKAFDLPKQFVWNETSREHFLNI